MRIIPAIDILDGRCVRLTQGDYKSSRTYVEDPVELARFYSDQGFNYLHLVDLDGAREGRVVNWDILEKIASLTPLKIDFGGGVKTTEEARRVLSMGVVQFTAGSVAVKEPELVESWLKEFGPDSMVLGADARNRRIAVSGWTEQTERDVFEFVFDYLDKGFRYVLCTDISRDGMLNGPSLDLYRDMILKVRKRASEEDREIPFRLIASGGIHEMNDFSLLKELGCEAVVVGKALLEGKLEVRKLASLSE